MTPMRSAEDVAREWLFKNIPGWSPAAKSQEDDLAARIRRSREEMRDECARIVEKYTSPVLGSIIAEKLRAIDPALAGEGGK